MQLLDSSLYEDIDKEKELSDSDNELKSVNKQENKSTRPETNRDLDTDIQEIPKEKDDDDTSIQRIKNISKLDESSYYLDESGEFKQFCCRFNTPKNLLAVGSEDNIIRIYDIQNTIKKPQYFLKNEFVNEFSAVTNITWKPFLPGSHMQNILISTHSNGEVIFWHATSKKILKRVKDQENAVNCVDYNKYNIQFATGGYDQHVRIYDENRTQTPYILEESTFAPVHQNRVYALKFVDDSILLSAGWDKTILIWDIRTKKSVDFIFGPEICGDSLDYYDNKILTGSFRDNKQIQLFDLRNLKNMQTVDLFEKNSKDQQFIYAAKFSPNGKKIGNLYMIVTGSAGKNMINVINLNLEVEKDIECDYGVYSLDFYDDQQVAFCGGSGYLGLYNL